jgi:hypothetical protein
VSWRHASLKSYVLLAIVNLVESGGAVCRQISLCPTAWRAPCLLEERKAELVDESFTMSQLLNENQLTKLSITTIFRWMEHLGFKYETCQKIYYVDVDGHKKPETKKYRKMMVKKIAKQYKSHQSAADFDAGFINRIVEKMHVR